MPTVEIRGKNDQVIVTITSDVRCDECFFFLTGPSGDFCGLFREDIPDIQIARECDGFQP